MPASGHTAKPRSENTTGKKFAPKAARRRPAVAPAPSAAEPAPSAPEPVQLPTPAATQLSIPSSAPISTPHAPALNHGADEQNARPESSLSTADLPLSPAPHTRDEPQQPEIHAPNAISIPASTRPEVRSPQPTGKPQAAVAETTVVAPGVVSEVAEVAEVQNSDENLTQPPSRKRRRLPWNAVNDPQDGEPDENIVAPPNKTRRKTKAKSKADADRGADHVEQQGDDEDESQRSRKRVSAKARGKRNAVSDSAEGETDQTAPERARKPRKARPVAVEGAEMDGDASQPVEDNDVTTARRKPRQPKRRKKKPTDTEGGEGEGSSQQKRKGRPPREPTPSDAEDQTIDPEETYMDSLASCNIRVGKLSNREREMRKVDWVAVRERRREEDSRPIQSKQEQEAADKALAEASAALDAQQVESGPRFREVDGRIEMIPDSGTINREADADREIAEYEVIEDQDITARITSRSFLKNNKRFPNDFILPGQGRRWNTDSTDLFYQGLKSFGTDFQMISQMFPGSTRRSMKTKFTREERDDPERVREALHGQSEIVSHWDVFLEASQRNEESFVDADEIKRQLAEDEAIMREKIEAAKLETEERNRQRVAAGVLDGEDGDEAGSKENGKGKKKRKDKGKQVTFQEEQGLEIIGTIDDDDTWGRE